MEKKAKITAEIPAYLKEWIDRHDISQNALVTMGLRRLYLEETKTETDKIIKGIADYFENKKLPF